MAEDSPSLPVTGLGGRGALGRRVSEREREREREPDEKGTEKNEEGYSCKFI